MQAGVRQSFVKLMIILTFVVEVKITSKTVFKRS